MHVVGAFFFFFLCCTLNETIRTATSINTIVEWNGDVERIITSIRPCRYYILIGSKHAKVRVDISFVLFVVSEPMRVSNNQSIFSQFISYPKSVHLYNICVRFFSAIMSKTTFTFLFGSKSSFSLWMDQINAGSIRRKTMKKNVDGRNGRANAHFRQEMLNEF